MKFPLHISMGASGEIIYPTVEDADGKFVCLAETEETVQRIVDALTTVEDVDRVNRDLEKAGFDMSKGRKGEKCPTEH